MDLHIFWFVLLGILLAGYAMLDGFDLGVGILHLTARSDTERRIFLNSVGPIWDGNEVWLVTFGGAMFAAFPEAYATTFSGFYVAFMAIVFCLIFRAISVEFRGKAKSLTWRKVFDFGFFASSLVASLLFGTAVGAAMVGVPLNERGIFVGNFWDELGLYPLAIGAMTAAMFAMHGAIFLYLKTEGELQKRIHDQIWTAFGLFLVLYLFVTVLTLVKVPRATQNFEDWPWAWGLVLIAILSIGNIPRTLFRNQPGRAFASSCLVIVSLVGLFGVALFPNLVTSSPNPENSLTVYNAASSESTLRTMALIAAIGVPFVLGYTGIVYWTFRGKVKLGEHSY